MAATTARPVLSSKIYIPLFAGVRHVKRWVKPKLIVLKRRNKIFRETTDPQVLLELQKRSGYVEWNRDAEIYAFAKRLQEDFQLNLLNQAFTHKSYFIKEQQKLEEFVSDVKSFDFPDNGQLLNLGDKIISDYVWNYFAHFFPKFPLEGITSVTNYLISTEVLSHVSKNIGTSDIILSSDYPPSNETLANTLKAIVGALKQSKGIDRSNILVRDLIVTQFCGRDINDFLNVQNYFAILCDILQRDKLGTPEPRIICQSGLNTILANYHVGIYLNKKLLGHCSGESIDIAIDMAAYDTLKRFFGTVDSAEPLKYDAEISFEKKIQHNLPLSEWCLSRVNKQ